MTKKRNIYHRMEGAALAKAPGLYRLLNPVLGIGRLYYGAMLAYYGYNKFLDLENTTSKFASLNIPYPEIATPLAAGAELGCGALMAIGFLGRLNALVLAFVMLVAHFSAHPDLAFYASGPFPYFCASIAVVFFGPGAWSIDGALAPKPEVKA